MAAPLVLIVEDNAQVRAALATVLRGAGYRTLEVPSAEARGLLHFAAPQVVLVDHGGSGQAGPELIRWLRRDGSPGVKSLPVVGLSGSGLEATALLGAGASRLLHKPFGTRALIAAVALGRPATPGGLP
jgi:CheY-like chemotaxis protein